MTLLKKYGIIGAIKKFKELSKSIPFTQILSYTISESIGYLRGFYIKYLYRWGYFGKFVNFGKNVHIPFKASKYIGDYADIRDFCRIECKGIVKIGNNSGIGEYGILRSSQYVSLGNNILIGPRVFITDSDHGFESNETPIYLQNITSGKVSIEDDVYIGANVIILKNVTIGKGAIIGAGSVVTKNIPENTVAAGNPARIIKERKEI